MKKSIATLIVATSMIIFCACGADDVVTEKNGSITDPPPDESHQIPTVTIEELRREERVGECRNQTKVWWRLSATPRPKTDLAVRMQKNNSKFWVIIPKSKNSSEELNDTFNFDGEIQIQPLPTVSIVGKGVVIDLERLQKGLPTYARGEHKIPADYDFPPYKVGEPSKNSVGMGRKHPGFIRVETEFQHSNPPDGGELSANATLVVGFRAEPGSVTVNGKPASVRGRTATLRGPHDGDGSTPFNITWENGPCQKPGSHTITLNVIQPDNAPPRIIRKNFRSKDADPEPLNRNGIIIEFSEPIAKHSLKLTLENGTHLGWLPKVDGMKITFEPLKGKELGNETIYIVQGAVFDAAGNRSNVKEIFVTRLKE